MRARTIAVALAVVAAGTLVACSDSESKAKLYDRAPVPAVPDATAAVPATGTLPDGQYWADMAEVVDGNIELTLMQAFFGPSCVAALGEEECPNDYGVQLEPSVTMRVMADSTLTATVAADSGQNYVVFGDELATLVGGGQPASSAPEGYTYVPFPFLVTIAGGTVTELHQIWVP
ncbi:MAG: hypothetical protein R2694_04370 [Ilumatobacteraceae bacterium]